MKKILYTALMTMLVIVLGACSGNETNTISVADLTDRENDILSMITNDAFVFDFDVDDTYQEVNFWVEKYESGKLVGEKINDTTAPVYGKGSLIFTRVQNPDDENQFMFTTGIKTEDDEESDLLSSRSLMTEKKGLGNASITTRKVEEPLPLKGEMVLASICYTLDENGATSLSSDFYEDPKRNMDELKEFDVAFLLKGEFK
ncbi:hypothetical protein ACQKL5_19310 [Peribacillus sp. NPDC097675]|uniref:hypothetical protein n=1 Tax=Peribacillus sp. NPDC097675 TaxID=3390618 RepID=UPI003CFE1F10